MCYSKIKAVLLNAWLRLLWLGAGEIAQRQAFALGGEGW